ncbi:hypothetical protein GKZ68_06600 [Hymenobacter sp. BRD128]|uniref:hypothetical protein n=1 Tax=Hymenobacter sp. BRD128 TaxID=2675878 RepID=UPI0015650B08|nr:hypothetical protein [Hymenobacter sp. BRD128]QKG56335.1 hypothetical protein GKZ68_06600 [Hymenobacter sp. BRD128]
MTTGKDLLALGFKSGEWFKDALAHLNAHGLEGAARLAYLDTVKQQNIDAVQLSMR